jgi:hypothetical protein
MSTLVLAQQSCASGNPWQVQNLGPGAPVHGQVQILECEQLAPIIQCESNMCQAKIFLFDVRVQVLYNYYINRREPIMTTADFFADFDNTQYSEFVEYELSKIFQCTDHHTENFDLDVPF